MTKISNLVVAVLLLSAVPLLAQSEKSVDPKAPIYKTVTLSLAGVGTTAGGATTTVTNQFIDVRGMQSVTLQTKFNFADATTSNVVYSIAKSIDKTNWETAPSTWTVAGNGTTDVIATTEIDVGTAGWLKLVSIQNTHASIVCTNKAFIAGIKRNSP